MLIAIAKFVVCALILTILFFSRRKIGFRGTWILLTVMFTALSLGSDITIWNLILSGFLAAIGVWLFMSLFAGFQQLRLKYDSAKQAKAQQQES